MVCAWKDQSDVGLESAGNLMVALCVQGRKKLVISSGQDLRLGYRA